MKTKLTTLFIICFVIITVTSQAQAPGGNCALAVLINGNGNIPCCTGAATVSDFTIDGAAPSCLTGTYRRDGWYSFINPVTQSVNVTATSTTVTSNLIIQVFSVCGGPELGCVNSLTLNSVQTESMCLPLAAGTYFIKISNYSTTVPANMNLSNVCVSPCSSIGITENNNQNPTFTISPNPFTSQTIITFDKEIKNTTIYIRDVLGNTIQQLTTNN